MRKIIAITLILALLCSFAVIVNAAKTDNLVDANNSGFEGVTDIKKTQWYRLVNEKGSTAASDTIYKNISIKSDGGYTGANYLSMTATASWHSPSINFYPFIKEAGAGTYVISFRYRVSASYKPSRICVRGLASDLAKNPALDFALTEASPNYYFFLNGTSSATADKGWYLFTSRAFTIDASQLDGAHNWWFSIDQTPASSDTPWTIDIDDFAITKGNSSQAVTPAPTASTPARTPKPGTTITEVVENEDNLINVKDSTFENVTDVKSTSWYKLVDAYGSSKNSSAMYTNISIGTDGGHTGKNYITMTSKAGWHSPSINIYPALKNGGENTYVLSFWYRANVDFTIKAIVIRGLSTDAYEDSSDFDVSIIPQNGGNYYANISGTTLSMQGSDWKCFYTEPFEFAQDQIDGVDHNWWFCLDQLKASETSPLTLDIDDFIIVPEGSFEEPEDPNDKDISTDITYLDKNTIDSALPKVTPIPGATPIPDTTPAPSLDGNADGTTNPTTATSNVAITVIITVAVFAVTLAGSFVVVKLIRKKK